MKNLRLMLVLAAALVAGAPAFAAEEAAKPDPAMMEKVKAQMSPGEPHKTLEPFAGKWNYKAKFWASPEAEPEETTGTTESAIVWGGRFLKEETKGTWMNEPFEGVGYTGYDNVKGEYVSVWMDSMMTGIMTMSGQYDAAAKTLKMAGANSCPMTGEKARPCRAETKMVDANHYTYSAFSAGADGKEFKGMEIEYTRQ
ncbi:MAG: DUF1579 domain-containing protein [Candidatus Omnitrophica bacterium]|nr:DUF1579 domain-containing protein [Candidatus Omnitrophota bacterium]